MTHRTRNRTVTIAMLTNLLFMVPQAHAADGEWTTVASACVPDESSNGLYNLEQARFEFRGARPGRSLPAATLPIPMIGST